VLIKENRMASNPDLPRIRHIAGPERVAAGPPAMIDKSVIGKDLKITGQELKIIGRGALQVDGEIQGDVQAVEVIIGERGKVTGMVAGQQVTVRGIASGVICAKTVVLEASARVEGDIHHMALVIGQGALFEGRSRRAVSEVDLQAVAESRARVSAVGS
jgi:cytoskeletal protein CcmA (bactofilin family)